MAKEKPVMGSDKNIRYKADEKDAGLLSNAISAVNVDSLRKSSASPYYQTADIDPSELEYGDSGAIKTDKRSNSAISTAGRKGTQSGRKAVKGESKFEQFKKGGAIKSSASKRADGCAQRGKTRGKMV